MHGYPSYPIAFEETVSEDPRTGIITEMIEAFPYDRNKDEDENENGESEEIIREVPIDLDYESSGLATNPDVQ